MRAVYIGIVPVFLVELSNVNQILEHIFCVQYTFLDNICFYCPSLSQDVDAHYLCD